MRSILVFCAGLLAALSVAGGAFAGGTAVKVENTASLGKVIATANGRTLYLFLADRGKASACYGICASYWPPLLASGTPLARTGAKSSLLGTTKRRDGKLQVTYKGHPLYLFSGDRRAGQTSGEGLDDFGAKWYALAPSGAAIDDD